MNPYRSSQQPEAPEPRQEVPSRRRLPVDFVDTIRRRWPDVRVTQISRLDGTFSWFIRLGVETGEVDYTLDKEWPWPVEAITAEVERMRTAMAARSSPLWSGRLRKLLRDH